MTQRIILMLILTLFCTRIYSQVEIKTEYLSPQTYENNIKQRTDGKSSGVTSSLNVRNILNVQSSGFHIPKLWFLTLSNTYTSLFNTGEASRVLPDKMFSLDIGVQHIRPIKQNLSLITGLSVGNYSSHANLSEIEWRNILGTAYGSLVWSVGCGLEVGIGAVVNNMYKYPMVIPTPYLKWYYLVDNSLEFDINLSYDPKISIGYIFSDKFTLKVINRPRKFFSFEKKNGEEMMYERSYVSVSLEPEFNFGRISIPISLGGNFVRIDRYRRRTPITLFRSHSPNFNPSFYGAIALRINFGK